MRLVSVASRAVLLLSLGLGLGTALLHAGRTTPPSRVPAEREPAQPAAVATTQDLPMLTAEERALLDEALARFSAEVGRWAYTQTSRASDEDGETVLRYDPSLPDDEQWTPLQLEGKPVNDPRDVARWRKKNAKQRSERRSLGELLDAGGARLFADEPAAVVFELPLRRDDNFRFPPEKFQVLMRVDKKARALLRIDVKARESFRIAGIAKVTAADLAIEFAPVAPDHPPLAVRVNGGGAARVFFVSLSGSFHATRTNFKRVKPYSDRFSVKVGDVKALDF